MPSIINATTTNGVAVSGDNSGALALQTNNGTTAVTIDTSQNVLVGTSSNFGSGTYGLRVSNTATNGFGTLSLQGNRTVAEDTIGLVQAFNSSTEVTRIGSIQGTNATSGQIVFSTASTGTLAERMRINSTGALVLAGGAVSANGIGITFPATQSASSDANTLDDYEEGTWTPTFIFGGGSATYTTRTGTYTKVGRLVTVQILIVINTVSSPSSTLEITSLPFTVNADSKGAIAMWSAGASGSATTAWAGTPTPSTNNLRIYIYAGGTVSNPGALVVNSSSFYVTASYEAA
jgi:hypothetical protein